MTMHGARELRRSKAGSMPFALIAVALLLISSLFCVIYANINDKNDNTESIIDELENMDDVIDYAQDYITKGLGNIIYSISADGNGGTLTERAKRFDSLEGEWFESEFPLNVKGVAVDIVDRDIRMDIQSMRMSSNDILAERSVASYLRATGTVEVTFSGNAGTTTRTLDINADGTSGLPFIVDCATKFELSTEGGASLLSQLVSYQLSALAQSRIVNGYGLRSVSGGMGTSDIITRTDVENAFRNALTAVETLCFRNNGQNDRTYVDNRHIDLGEKAVLRNGYYEIDIGAILSQALLSIVDEVIMRWMSYFSIDKIVEVIDKIVDFAKELLNNIISFFTGNQEDNKNSARYYIKEAMRSCGYSESDYRYVSGNSHFIFEGATIEFTYKGERQTLEYPYIDIDPEDINSDKIRTDIFDWNGWNNYVVDYNRNRNAIEDYIRGTLQSICSGITANYGIIRIRADEYDDQAFMDSYTSAVCGHIDGCLDGLTYSMESSLRQDNVTDMLLASIYQTMVENRGSIFREDQIKNDIIDGLERAMVLLAVLGNHLAAEDVADEVHDLLEHNPSIDAYVTEYRRNVDSVYEIYQVVMNSPRNQGSSALKELIVTAGKEVLKQSFVKDTVTRSANGMMTDICEHIRMNSDYGILELECKDRFLLSDGYGGLYEEFADISDSYGLNITITDPRNNPGNQHSISCTETRSASYLSVFTVRIKGELNYVAHSMSGVDRSLGRFDSEFRDTLDIDMTLDINCISAWSLVGAYYKPTTNIFNDVWNILLKAIEPMLEPLKRIYGVMKDILSVCNETVMEINSYATALMDKIYSVIMEPLDMLTELISEWISMNLCSIVENLCGFVEGFDIGASTQKITFAFFGLHLTVELRAATLLKTTKNIVKLTLEGNVGDTKFSAFIDMKKNEKNGLMVRGGGGIENDDCAIDLVLDPHMKFGSKLVKLSGTVRDVDMDICLPYRETYDRFEMALSDIPGVAESISNIPLPIPGYKCAFDMGIELKYNLPLGTGLMINEFESNPAGNDDGAEWIELYNATANTINLSGYMVVPESNEAKAFIITGTSIAPFEKKVIDIQKQSLNNSKSGKHSGESISLYNPQGEKVDSTPWKKDTYNDDRTWQRKADGSTTWVFMKGTPGSSNGSIIKTNALAKEFLIDCMLKAADRAFEEMGNHLKSVDDITAFLERTLQLFVKNVIDTIADIIVSASVFISMELTDYAQIQHYGLKVAFEMNSDLVREGIYWLLKQLDILQDVVREPCCNDLDDIICENTYLTTTVFTSISTPKFLATLESEEIDVGYKTGVNVRGLSNLIWNEDEGRWKAILGVVAEDLDATKLPKGLRSDKDKRCDLWLIKVELSKSDSPKNG